MASEGVLEYNYVSEPDADLQCAICLGLVKDPLQHEECGKLFCEECIEKYGKYKRCPHCRTKGSKFYRDKISECFIFVDKTSMLTSAGQSSVLALRVNCNNVNGECEWEGTVGTLEEHVATCEFALVPCPKQCKSSDDKVEYFMNKAVDEHLEKDCPNRDYECEHCGEKGTFANITQVHDEKCEKKMLPCPNADCTDIVQRQSIKRHLDSCIYTEVPCKYRDIGCDVKMRRDALSAHEDGEDKLHLHMALDTIIKGMGETKKSITFSMREFQRKKEESILVRSPSFYTSTGFNIYIRIKVQGTHVSLYADAYGQSVGITCELLNQMEDNNHHVVTWDFGDQHYADHLIPNSELDYDPVKNTQYLKDDTLYFRVTDHRPWLQCTCGDKK